MGEYVFRYRRTIPLRYPTGHKTKLRLGTDHGYGIGLDAVSGDGEAHVYLREVEVDRLISALTDWKRRMARRRKEARDG